MCAWSLPSMTHRSLQHRALPKARLSFTGDGSPHCPATAATSFSRSGRAYHNDAHGVTFHSPASGTGHSNPLPELRDKTSRFRVLAALQCSEEVPAKSMTAPHGSITLIQLSTSLPANTHRGQVGGASAALRVPINSPALLSD